MTEAEQYHALLLQKKELVFRLLRLANETTLEEEDAEQRADHYIALVEARQALIEQLQALDDALGGLGAPPDPDGALAALTADIKAMAGQIIRREADIRKKAAEVAVRLRRGVNAAQARRQEAQNRGEYTKGLRFQSNG